MLFKEVIGQTEVKQHLAKMVQQNRVSHALLFLASEGSGGLPLALAFAQYLVCEKTSSRPSSKDREQSLFGFEQPADPTPYHTMEAVMGLDACGVCPACKKAHQLVHPDIHYSYPVIPKKKW